MLRIPLVLFSLFGVIFSAASKDGQIAINDVEVYASIKRNLESNLYQLPPRIQGHYSIRQYRVTGDAEKYANSALVDLYAVSDAHAYYACNIDKPDFIAQEAQKAVAALANNSRGERRRNALSPFPEFIFYTDILLRYSSRIDEFGLKGQCHDKMLTLLKQVDLSKGLTDESMIRAWAAQLINYVYWAKQVGAGDYLDVYKAAFRKVYQDSADGQLNVSQFRNKLYGMTHFIIAASGYYQHKVDAKEFDWILNYFERNIDLILTKASDDIIAEVGITYLLAGKPDHRVVSLTRDHIVNSFDNEKQMILGVEGSDDLAKGEHRNVLAMMLLGWPDALHAGPYLAQLPQTAKMLPRQVQLKSD
ncbi:DUF3541 domain-containing protein [Vibrio pectenicida]|nr:DUF3541 domain-containing protein [Vibrio pectenicida]